MTLPFAPIFTQTAVISMDRGGTTDHASASKLKNPRSLHCINGPKAVRFLRPFDRRDCRPLYELPRPAGDRAMPTKLVARRGANAPVLSAAELRRKLTDASRLPCTVGGDNGATRFVLGRDHIAVALRSDDDGPDAAFLEFSPSTRIRAVTAVCKTFRALGWTFQD